MKIAVVGAGIVGTAVAFHLASAGAEVVVVDDDRPGRATRAGAGIVSPPLNPDDVGTAAFELAGRAFDAYPELVKRLGGSHELWDVIGALHVAPKGPDLDGYYAQLCDLSSPVGQRAGVVRLLEQAETTAAFPYLRSDLAAVSVTATARLVGEAVREALARAAIELGAQFETGAAALDTAGDRVTGVVVGGHREGADAVVVAAGAWSAEVVRAIGVDLAVDAQRGQILHLRLPGVDTSKLPIVIPIGATHYILPFADSRIVVGATRETGSGFDPRLTAAGMAEVLRDALGVAPGLASATIAQMRVGLRPVTPDDKPLLGPVADHPGLWVATGMGPRGLTIGPYCGWLVARLVLGWNPDIEMAPFAPDRSAGPRSPGSGT